MLEINPADSTILTYLAGLAAIDGQTIPEEEREKMLKKLSNEKTLEIGRLLIGTLSDNQASTEAVALAKALREGIRNSGRNAPHRS
jgi:hypothetical protein